MALPIQTERLVLRELTAGDVPEVARAFADPEVIWWRPAPFTREDARDWVARARESYSDAGMGLYAVVLRAGGRLIGDCGLVPRVIDGEHLVETGWHLERSAWGRGYATEAARGVLAHAAGLGIHRVCALIVPENARSRRVAVRLGMAVDRRVEWSGRAHDLWMLDLPWTTSATRAVRRDPPTVNALSDGPHVRWAADLRATMNAPPLDEST